MSRHFCLLFFLFSAVGELMIYMGIKTGDILYKDFVLG